MLSAFSRLLSPRTPTIEIVGVGLTHEEVDQLIYTCSTLRSTLQSQIETIQQLSAEFNSRSSATIHSIQNRQIRIQENLSYITLKTQSSAVMWVHELSDARVALAKKIVSINRQSRRIGWMVAARLSWPIVAETYIWLLSTIRRLQHELEESSEKGEPLIAPLLVETPTEQDQQQPELAALRNVRLRTTFQRDVEVREYQVGTNLSGDEERSDERTYCVELTDDRKRTAGRFKGRRAKYMGEIEAIPPMPM